MKVQEKNRELRKKYYQEQKSFRIEQKKQKNIRRGIKKEWIDFLKVVKATEAKYFKNSGDQNILFYYDYGKPTIRLSSDYNMCVMVKNCSTKSRIINRIKREIGEV